jgi:hypothetical protein
MAIGRAREECFRRLEADLLPAAGTLSLESVVTFIPGRIRGAVLRQTRMPQSLEPKTMNTASAERAAG